MVGISLFLSFFLSWLILIYLLASVGADFVSVRVHRNYSECDIYCVRVQIGLSTHIDLSSADICYRGLRYTEKGAQIIDIQLYYFFHNLPPPHNPGSLAPPYPQGTPSNPQRFELSAHTLNVQYEEACSVLSFVCFAVRLPVALVRVVVLLLAGGVHCMACHNVFIQLLVDIWVVFGF